MHSQRLLLLSPAVLASAQVTQIFGDITSAVVSAATSIATDITSGGASVGNDITSAVESGFSQVR